MDLSVGTAGRLTWDDLRDGFFIGLGGSSPHQIVIAECGAGEANAVIRDAWTKLMPTGLLFLRCDTGFTPQVDPHDWGEVMIQRNEPDQPHYLYAIKADQ